MASTKNRTSRKKDCTAHRGMGWWGMKKRTISDLRVKHLHADLGMAVGHASEILTGKKSPSLRLAVRLEDAYGIKPRAWLENLRERN
jgi:plasmid maintenance system antidote protein VapI